MRIEQNSIKKVTAEYNHRSILCKYYYVTWDFINTNTFNTSYNISLFCVITLLGFSKSLQISPNLT